MTYPFLIIIPLIAVAATQVIKFIIASTRGELSLRTLLTYGGMPSAHTAFVIAVATVVAMHEGIASSAFAVAAVFGMLIIRDAIGLRQFLSQHSRVLNMLIKDLPDEMEAKYPQQLAERLGHTPLQATVGALIGLTIAYGLGQFWL
jgi:acid phosphatase family membrane protein YuiD